MKTIIVVGAGILGASTAYQLSKLGAKVVVIDRKDAGQATDAAAGIICPWLSQRRNQAWYRLAKAGARFYPRLIRELEAAGESDTGYAQVGALCIHQEVQKIESMKERVLLRKEDAPEIGEVSILDEYETKRKFPLLTDGYHALHVSGAARVDGRALCHALLRAAERNGAEIIQGDAVLEHRSNEITAVKVDEQSFTADEVVVCAGAWANALLHPLGIMIDVQYQKAQIMHLQLAERRGTEAWPVVMPPSDQYLLAFADQRIVIGATHENNIEDYDTSVTAGGMQEILNKGLYTAAGLVSSSLKEIRVGFRPFTPGYLPVLGRIAGWRRLIVANGLGASGLTMGPFLGEQLAKLAMEQELDIELADYAVEHAIL